VIVQRPSIMPRASVSIIAATTAAASASTAAPSVMGSPVATSALRLAPQLGGFPVGWHLVDETILPVRVAVPDGWQVEVTSSDIEIFLEHKPETQTSDVSIYEESPAGDSTVDDLLRSTDLVEAKRTTIDGLPAIQGYSYYPYGHPNYSDKDVELFSPEGKLYLISYECPIPAERIVCDEIVSRVHFK